MPIGVIADAAAVFLGGFLGWRIGGKVQKNTREYLKDFEFSKSWLGTTEPWPEGAVAYVIVGPRDLPKVARWLGRLVRRARQMIRELKEEVGWNEMMAETADVRRDIDDALKEADVSAELKDAQQELRRSVASAEKEAMDKT